MSLNYTQGCVIEHAKSLSIPVIVPHIVNNAGKWGSGFVVAVSKYSKIPEQVYRSNVPKLGSIQICPTGHITFVNMCAQTFGTPKPIRYESLVQCMRSVVESYELTDYDHIVAPKFGSLRAGGNWDFIVELIEEMWCPVFDVTICHYN